MSLFISCFFFRQKNKNGHGRLVGLTTVTGRSVDKCLHCLKKGLKQLFLALEGLTKIKVRSVRKRHGIGCIPRSDSDVTLVGPTFVKGTSVKTHARIYGGRNMTWPVAEPRRE